MFSKKSLLSGLAALGLATVANAAIVINISPTVVQEYDGAFTPLGVPNLNVPHAPGHYYEVEFRMQISGLLAGQDFANVGFNVQNTGGAALAPQDLGGLWVPLPGVQFDSNGAVPGGSQNHWQVANGDPGNDLLSILVAVTASEANNRQYGETPRPGAGSPDTVGYPTLLGEVFYQWDGTTSANVFASKGVGTYMQIFTGNGAGAGSLLDQNDPADVTFVSVPLQFLPIPEPASASMLVLGMLGFAGRRRRD